MDRDINFTGSNDKDQTATFQEKVNVLADEVLRVMKELHLEQRSLVNSKLIAKKMFDKESIKEILHADERQAGIDQANNVDELKEAVDNILRRFSELVPLSMIENLTDSADNHHNKIVPADSTEKLDSAVEIVKKYVDSITSKVNELEDLLLKITNYLSKTEKYLMGELSSTQEKFQEDRTFDSRISDNMIEMKENFDISSDITAIKNMVLAKIRTITKTLEEKKEQDILRLQETEKTLEAMSKKMSDIVNEAEVIRKRSIETEIESLHDSLTKLYNRKAYDNKIEETLANFDRYSTISSLLVFDVDHFKSINDNFGHSVGDLILKKVAQICKEQLRKNDFIARYGGDEFVCILPYTQLENTREAADKIRSFIDKTSFTFEEKEIPITISVGVSTFKKEDNASTIFERADVALYLAKNSGRNLVKTEDDVERAGKNFSDFLIEMDFDNEK